MERKEEATIFEAMDEKLTSMTYFHILQCEQKIAIGN